MKVSRRTAAAGAPVTSRPPQPPAASAELGKGGRKRSTRRRPAEDTYTRCCGSTAIAPPVPRSPASLQKPALGSSLFG